MSKYQCEDICSNEKYQMGHTCCIFCLYKKECIKDDSVCDCMEVGIEKCPCRMEVK